MCQYINLSWNYTKIEWNLAIAPPFQEDWRHSPCQQCPLPPHPPLPPSPSLSGHKLCLSNSLHPRCPIVDGNTLPSANSLPTFLILYVVWRLVVSANTIHQRPQVFFKIQADCVIPSFVLRGFLQNLAWSRLPQYPATIVSVRILLEKIY